MRFGLQLFPSCTAPELVSYAKRALSQHPFDTVWLPDHLSYENVFVSLAALITQTEAHVGTSVAHPFGRTPVDLAASFAALSHLAGERGITVGLGTGAATSNMIRKQRRVPMVREMVLFLENSLPVAKQVSVRFRVSRISFASTQRHKPCFTFRLPSRLIFLWRPAAPSYFDLRVS